MDSKSDSCRGKYEDYENDKFYIELERWIVRLIDDVDGDELKPCETKTNASSYVWKDDGTKLLLSKNYYDWSVCRNSVGPPLSSFPAASFSGTGVFIPQHYNTKFEYRDCKK